MKPIASTFTASLCGMDSDALTMQTVKSNCKWRATSKMGSGVRIPHSPPHSPTMLLCRRRPRLKLPNLRAISRISAAEYGSERTAKSLIDLHSALILHVRRTENQRFTRPSRESSAGSRLPHPCIALFRHIWIDLIELGGVSPTLRHIFCKQ